MKVLMIGLDVFDQSLNKSSPFFIHHKKFSEVAELYNIARSSQSYFEYDYALKGHLIALPGKILFYPVYAVITGLRIIKKEGIDIIHVQDTLLTGFPGYILALLTKKPLISSFYGYITDDAYYNFIFYAKQKKYLYFLINIFKYSFLYILSNTITRLVIRKSKKIRVLTPALGKYAKKFGAKEYKIFQIPMRVSYDYVKQTGKKNYFPKGEFVILSIGQIIPRKGIDLLILSLPGLLKELPNTHLYIAGDGKIINDLINLAESLKVSTKIHFLGSLKPDDVLDYMKSASVFVLPTRSEGMGQVLIEALSVGTPVISTNVGGIPDFLTNDYDSILIPKDNIQALKKAIIKIATDKKFNSKIIRNGHLTAKKYSLNNTAKLLKDLFNSVLYENFNGNSKSKQ